MNQTTMDEREIECARRQGEIESSIHAAHRIRENVARRDAFLEAETILDIIGAGAKPTSTDEAIVRFTERVFEFASRCALSSPSKGAEE